MGYLNADKKQELFANYGKSNTDTGSPESRRWRYLPTVSTTSPHI